MQVLVAEDEEQFRAFLSRALRAMGHSVELAVDGEDLLRRAQWGVSDVVLSDVGLPRCDGIEACSRLRAARPSLHIVLMTGDPESAERASRAGFSPVLLKPFGLAQLKGALAAF